MPAATPLPRGPSVLTLYTAADLLTGPGCPVCRSADEAAVECAHMLIAELDRAFSKNTWAYRHEARGPEMTAWRRVAAFLDGRVGQLSGMP